MPAQNKPPQPDIVHQLHALLHTMRVIQQQEDEFCSVMHTIERNGRLRAAERRELERLLEQTPAVSLLHDLETIKRALPEPSSDEAVPPYAH